MIKILEHGDIFSTRHKYIVDPVNALGIHGAGLARTFAKLYPESVLWYNGNVKYGLQQGVVLVCPREENKRHVVFFVTKNHWSSKSTIDGITTGLQRLREIADVISIDAIAIPAVGCGLGRLNFDTVLGIMQTIFGDANTLLEIYPPWKFT